MPYRTWFFAAALAVLLGFASGCAFFNTFFNARKSYNNGVAAVRKAQQTAQGQNTGVRDLTIRRFDLESDATAADAKPLFDLAIEKGNKVVALYPTSGWVADAILLLGKAYYMRATGNDYYEAKNRFEVFMTKYPGHERFGEARLWYAKTLIKLKLIDQAQETLRQIPLTLHDADLQAEALINLGNLTFASNNVDVALGYFRQAAELKCRSELRQVATFKTAFCFYTVGRYDEALPYLRLLRKTDLDVDGRFDVQLMTAHCHKLQGQYQEALDVLNQMIGDLRFKNLYVHAEFEIADILRLQNKYDEASEQFRRVIDNYRNPILTGDSYFLLGLMNDTVTVSDSTRFRPDPVLARKYYQLVQDRYPQSSYAGAARARGDFLKHAHAFQFELTAQEALSDLCRRRMNDSLAEAGTPDWLGAFGKDTTATAAVAARQDTGAVAQTGGAKGAGRDQGKQPAPKSQPTSVTDLASVRLGDDALDSKVAEFKRQWALLSHTNSRDSLTVLAASYRTQLAETCLRIADYYYFDALMLDSAKTYYERIATQLDGTPSEEAAYYGLARIQQKLRSPNYRVYYETAYEKFPHGQLAAIAERILGLSAGTQDTLEVEFERAEGLLLSDNGSEAAIDRYRRIALKDTARLKLAALFNMGWLYEKKLRNPDLAFRMYNTLVFCSPASDLAARVKSKVDAYAQARAIKADSLVYCVDTAYFKIPPPKDTGASAVNLPRDSVRIARKDSAELALPDTLFRAPTDSLKHLETDSLNTDHKLEGKQEQDDEQSAKKPG